MADPLAGTHAWIRLLSADTELTEVVVVTPPADLVDEVPEHVGPHVWVIRADAMDTPLPDTEYLAVELTELAGAL